MAEEIKVAEEAQKTQEKAAKKHKKKKVFISAKKKTSTARAVIEEGKGNIRVNSKPIELVQNRYMQDMLREPLMLADNLVNTVDISVNTAGGGIMGQTISARSAIAKALVEYSKDKKLKQKMINYDRLLLVDDPRRVEPKKPLGRKARAKKQKSKR